MLQRLLIITLTLCSLTASAQWQQTGSKVRYVNGLGIPTKDTAAGVAADSSQILIRPADSSLYIKYKRTWVKVGAGGGGTIGGSGTINRVPKFTASTTLGNSSIVDSASAVAMTITPSGNVGIGTASPAAKLDVNGTFRIPGIGSNVNPTSAGTNPNYLRFFSTGADYYIGTEGASAGGFFTGSSAYDAVLYSTTALNYIIGGVSRMNIKTNGNTLINTTTDNGVDKLQVSGSMNVSAKATAQTLSVTSNAQVDGTTMMKGRATVNPSATTVFTDRLFEISGTAGTTGTTQFAFVQNPTFGTPTTIYSWYNSLNVTSATTSYGLYYDTESGSITNKWGLYFVGGSRNYLANTLLVGTNTDNNIDKLQVAGSIYSSTTLKGNDISIVGTGSIPTLTSTQFTTQSFSALTTAKTANYTTAFNDYFIDCTSGTFTVTLQAAASYQGRVLIIKNSGAGTITVDGNGAETIDGAATYSLAVQYATIQIMSDGTNWKIISKF
jgi:hypothetical protein